MLILWYVWSLCIKNKNNKTKRELEVTSKGNIFVGYCFYCRNKLYYEDNIGTIKEREVSVMSEDTALIVLKINSKLQDVVKYSHMYL